MKPRFLFHGSPKKLIGNKLVPKKAKDMEKVKENLHTGIYATDIKKLAIAMAIICSKGVNYSGLNFTRKNSKGIIYEGWPEQKEIYLYTLPSETFRRTGRIAHQFVSLLSVKPARTEKLFINDYKNLFRKSKKHGGMKISK